jgi:hypothetical protein
VKDSKGRVARDQASRRGQEKILDLLQPRRQANLMQQLQRRHRTALLGRVFQLLSLGRASLNVAAVGGSPSLQCLARVMGCLVPPAAAARPPALLHATLGPVAAAAAALLLPAAAAAMPSPVAWPAANGRFLGPVTAGAWPRSTASVLDSHPLPQVAAI